jgi:hypothetical protein
VTAICNPSEGETMASANPQYPLKNIHVRSIVGITDHESSRNVLCPALRSGTLPAFLRYLSVNTTIMPMSSTKKNALIR